MISGMKNLWNYDIFILFSFVFCNVAFWNYNLELINTFCSFSIYFSSFCSFSCNSKPRVVVQPCMEWKPVKKMIQKPISSVSAVSCSRVLRDRLLLLYSSRGTTFVSLNARSKDWSFAVQLKFPRSKRHFSLPLHSTALPTSKWRIGSDKVRASKTFNNAKLKSELLNGWEESPVIRLILINAKVVGISVYV